MISNESTTQAEPTRNGENPRRVSLIRIQRIMNTEVSIERAIFNVLLLQILP